MKELLPVAEEPLLNIINSLSLSHVPKPLKLAVIKPLIKKAKLDPCELANYRPISHPPFMSKILEKVVSAQFLLKNDIYEEFQSGFRPCHSTETALVKITNDLLLASDKGCISLLVLLDLSAAFNTIDHDILIDRLQNYTGIQGQALRWFRSYLSDRYHFVYLNGEASQLSPVKYGVVYWRFSTAWYGTVRYGTVHFWGVFHWVLYLVPDTFLVPLRSRFQVSHTITKT